MAGAFPVQCLASGHCQMSVSSFFACPHSLSREGQKVEVASLGPALAGAPLQLPGLASRADSRVWTGLEFVFDKLCRPGCCVAGADSLAFT